MGLFLVDILPSPSLAPPIISSENWPWVLFLVDFLPSSNLAPLSISSGSSYLMGHEMRLRMNQTKGFLRKIYLFCKSSMIILNRKRMSDSWKVLPELFRQKLPISVQNIAMLATNLAKNCQNWQNCSWTTNLWCNESGPNLTKLDLDYFLQNETRA